MNETVLTAFVIIAALAIVIQAGILAGMFFTMKKTSARMEDVAKKVEDRALPVLTPDFGLGLDRKVVDHW